MPFVFGHGVERRSEPRFSAGEMGSAVFRFGAVELSGQVEDISVHGIGFVCGDSIDSEVVGSGGSLFLGGVFREPVPVSVVYVSGGRLGMVLDPVNRSRLSDLSFRSSDRNWDYLSTFEQVEEILGDIELVSEELDFFLEVSGRSLSASFVSRDDAGLVFRGFGDVGGLGVGCGLMVSFELFGAFYIFRSKVLGVDGDVVRVERPAAVVRLFRRATSRLSLESGEGWVSFCHPWTGQRFRVGIRDLCERGVCVDGVEGGLYPVGLEIKDAELGVGDVLRISVDLVFRGHGESGSLRFGVFPCGHGDGERLINYVMERRYPGWSFEYRDEDHDRIWELFDRSGYLDQKERELFEWTKSATQKTWYKISRHVDPKISQKIIRRDSNSVIGHLQFDRFYRDSWVIHHLAISPDVSKIIAKDIYFSLTDLLINMDIKFVVSYAMSSKPWNQRNYYDFIKLYPYPSDNSLKFYYIYDVPVDLDFSIRNDDHKLEIDIANENDKKFLIKFLKRSLTPLEIEALSYNSIKELELKETSQVYSGNGLLRGREILVCKLGREIISFCTLEYGTTGISIFNLPDLVQFFHCIELSDDQKQKIEKAFLEEAKRYYRKMGKKSFLLLNDDYSQKEWYVDNGIKFICECSKWIANQRNFTRYKVYIGTVYGRLLARRKKIKEKIRLMKKSREE